MALAIHLNEIRLHACEQTVHHAFGEGLSDDRIPQLGVEVEMQAEGRVGAAGRGLLRGGELG